MKHLNGGSHRICSFIMLLTAATIISSGPADSYAQREARTRRPSSPSDFAAKRLLKRGQDLILVGEHDRAVKMLESVPEQYPDSAIRYEAWLELGRHFISQFQQPQALVHLMKIKELAKLKEELQGDQKDVYLESLYLTGVAYYQTKQFSKAFPVLRRITTKYQNTVWANQAYYYIGMCHFAQENWNKAIEALNLVGTFVDPNSPEIEYVEAGRRFYVKIDDADLPILQSLGRKITIQLEAASGDKETVFATPLPGKQTTYISSTPTTIGRPTGDDGILQIRGRDSISVTYLDDNTKIGEKDLARVKQVAVVSTAAASFTTATFEQEAIAAFLKQPLFIVVQDADEDKTDQADQIKVRLVCRYKEKSEDEEEIRGLQRVVKVGEDLGFDDEQVRYKVRDEVTLTLAELKEVLKADDGDDIPAEPADQPKPAEPAEPAAIHTGRFGGSVMIDIYTQDENVNKTDNILTAAIADEIIVNFVDDLHINGRSPRVATAKTVVAGVLKSGVTARQNVVTDELLKAKKSLVEATALLELARLFDSMGLKDGAENKAVEGLGRVDPIIRVSTPIPAKYKEEAFKLKWELYIVQDKFGQAIETCQLFNRLYPDSPFVDRALMGIGIIKQESKDYESAIQVFRQVLKLQKSQAKGEAQFRIADALETQARDKADEQIGEEFSLKNAEAAIQAYKLCAEKYSDSPYAGPSLAKLVDYYMETRDYVQADDLLQQVFDKYPDAKFLDEMLLKWVKVAYRTGAYAKSLQKCQQLIFEYPGSAYASSAKKVLPLLEKKVESATGASATESSESEESSGTE